MPDASRLEFVVCIRNEGHARDLLLRRLYQVVVDAQAMKRGRLRVVDETGAEGVYPEDYFLRLPVPEVVWRVVLNARG